MHPWIHSIHLYSYTNIGTYILVLYDIIFSIYCTTTVWYLTPYNEAFAEEFLVDAKIEHKHTLEPSVAGRMKALLQKSRYEEEVSIWEVLLLSCIPRRIELWPIVPHYPNKKSNLWIIKRRVSQFELIDKYNLHMYTNEFDSQKMFLVRITFIST